MNCRMDREQEAERQERGLGQRRERQREKNKYLENGPHPKGERSTSILVREDVAQKCWVVPCSGLQSPKHKHRRQRHCSNELLYVYESPRDPDTSTSEQSPIWRGRQKLRTWERFA